MKDGVALTVMSREGKCSECGAADGRIYAIAKPSKDFTEIFDMCEYCRTIFESDMAPEEVEARQRDNKILCIAKWCWVVEDCEPDYYNTWLLRKFNGDLKITKEEVQEWIDQQGIGAYSHDPGMPFAHTPSIEFLKNGRLVLIEQSCGLDV